MSKFKVGQKVKSPSGFARGEVIGLNTTDDGDEEIWVRSLTGGYGATYGASQWESDEPKWELGRKYVHAQDKGLVVYLVVEILESGEPYVAWKTTTGDQGWRVTKVFSATPGEYELVEDK